MYNTYVEMAALKELFTKKFEAQRLFDCVINTKSGCLLQFFDSKQLDKLNPGQIMKIMSEYKSDVLRAYKNTSNRILKAIIDYCLDCDKKPEQIIEVSPKEVDWLYYAMDKNICDIQALMKNRFHFNKKTKIAILNWGNMKFIQQFKVNFNDKELIEYLNQNMERNYKLITLLKKPSIELIRYYLSQTYYDSLRDVAVLDSYPIDFLIEVIDSKKITQDVKNVGIKQYGKLLETYYKLVYNSAYDTDYGIDDSGDNELINYTNLVNNDKEMIKGYLKEKLLSMK